MSHVGNKNPYGFIYETTNLVNGKKYIGQKKIDNEGRWKNYLGSGVLLKQAIKKYGKANFKREILEFAYDNDELNKLEVEYIEKYQCVSSDKYYNLVEGGGTVTGLKFSQETLQRMSERNRGLNNPFYGKGFYGDDNHFYGKKHSIESRRLMSESRKGLIPWSKGKTGIYSKETIHKMRIAKLGKPLTKSHRDSIRKAQQGENHPMYGKRHSEDSKMKMRTAALNRNDRGSNHSRSREVLCITTGTMFSSLVEAAQYYSINRSSISMNCSGRTKSAGSLPDGTRLKWKYI